MANLTKAIFRKEAKTIGHLKKPDGCFTKSWGEILNTLMDSFFPQSTLLREVDCPTRVMVMRANLSNIVTSRKVEAAFKSFKGFKAPGLDELRPVTLKHLDEKTMERISVLYNVSLSLGYIPKVWRGAKVILIPKSGKDDYSDPRAFRPITLSSFILKGLERVVAWHLEELGIVNKLSPRQHAFRKHHGTDTALSEVVNVIESSVLRGGNTLGVFFDIQGAFDNVRADKVIEGMRLKAVPEEIVIWYGYYLKNRNVSMSLGSKTVQRSITRGTPQGGILSRLMWNLLFDVLLTRLQGFSAVKPYGYADDGMFLVSGICPETLVDLAQPAIDCAVAWGEENDLSFSTKKTAVVLFSRKRNLKLSKKLRMNGEELEYMKEVKYLGIKLNHKLNWQEHILDRIKYCKGLMVRLRTAIGARWGPSPRMMLWAFNSLVIQALSYGVVVWGSQSLNSKIESELRRLNRLAAVGFAPMRRGTPTAGLEVILNLKPLTIVMKECGLASFTRLSKGPTWDGLGHGKQKGHRRFWGDLCEALKIDHMLVDGKRFSQNWHPPVRTDKDGKTELRCLIKTVKGEGWVSVGYCLLGGGVGSELGTLKITGKNTSQCLYKGLQTVCEDIKGMVKEGVRIELICDFVPITLFNPFINCRKVDDLLTVLCEMRVKSGNKVILRSHRAAGSSSEILKRLERAIVPESALGCTHAALSDPGVIKSIIRTWGSRKWQSLWRNLPQQTNQDLASGCS